MSACFRILLVSACFVVGGVCSLKAQCNSPERSSQPIPFGAQAVPLVTVPTSLLGAAVASLPLHGQLSRDLAGRLLYTPDPSFWTVGSDRLTLVGAGPTLERHIVQLLAPTRRVDESREQAEARPADGGLWQLEDPTSAAGFETVAALAGERGLWIAESPAADAYLKAGPRELLQGYGDAGTGAQGGWKPPGSGGGGGHYVPSLWPWPQAEALILTLGAPGELHVGVRARTTPTGVELRLEASGTDPGPWLPVSLVPHQIQLLAWDRAQAPSLATLFVDGELVATAALSFPMSAVPTREVRFGSQDADLGMPAHGWDELATFMLPADAPRALCLREDGFDREALAGQWQTYGSNYLDLESGAERGFGVLRIDPAGPGSPAGGLVIANNLMPQAIGRLGVRFDVDTESLTLPEGSTVLLADAANNQWSRSFRVLLDGTAAGPRLRVIATHLDNLSVPAATTSFPLEYGARFEIEIDWQRSTTDRVGTGYLRLFVNGEEKAELIGLHNHTQKLMDVRVGSITVAGNPSGKVALDDLELWYEPQ